MAKTKKTPLYFAGDIVDRFGGIRPMAQKIDTPVTTVQGWKKRDVIPAARRDVIIKAAEENNVDLKDILERPVPDEVKATTPSKAATKKATSKKSAAKKSTTKKAAKSAPAKSENESKSEKKPSSADNAKKAGVAAATATGATAAASETAATPKTEKIEKTAGETSAGDGAASSPTESKPAQKENTRKDEELHSRNSARLDKQNDEAVKIGKWIAVALALLVLALVFFLFLPSLLDEEQETEAVQERVEQLETRIDDMGAPTDNRLLSGFEGLKEQTRMLQEQVGELSEQARTVSGVLMDEEGGPLSDRLARLEEEVEMLSGSEDFASLINRVQQLENSFAGQTQLEDAVAQLQKIVANLSGGESVDGDLARVQADGEGALGETLEGVSGDDLKAAAMLIAFAKFRDTVNREEPFGEDLALLQKLAGEDNPELQGALTRLAPQAESGVLTTQGLSKEFKSLGGDIAFAALEGKDVSVRDQAMTRLNNVFQVEKNGEPVMLTDTQATVVDAQAMLDEGNIEGAIATLQGLQGPAAQEAAPFIKQANATLMMQRVQTMLNDFIVNKVSDGQNGASAGEAASGQNMGAALPSFDGLDMSAVRKAMEDVLSSSEREVIRDPQSGVVILPADQAPANSRPAE